MRDEAPRIPMAALLAGALGCGLSTGGVTVPDDHADVPGGDGTGETVTGDDAGVPGDEGTPPADAPWDPTPPDDAGPDLEPPDDVPASCGNGTLEAGEECEGTGEESCLTGCGSTGTHFCSACNWGPCLAPPETCNGVDDDCNGATDEGCGPLVPNDHCDGAVDISAGGEFAGTTIGAVQDQDHCSISAYCDPGGSDVFYRFTLTEPEVVFLSLQGAAVWDAVLTVRSEGCGGPVAACSDDACENYLPQWVGRLEAGSYWAVVDGCDPDDSSAFTLKFAHAPCPNTESPSTRLDAADTCWGNSCGWGNETSSACGGRNHEDVPMYFGLCPGSHTVGASTCGDGQSWQSSLSIRTGGGGICGGVEAGCSGPLMGSASCYANRSRVERTVTGPELVFVLLDGAGMEPACGDFEVEVWF
jgi:hypothetical protein